MREPTRPHRLHCLSALAACALLLLIHPAARGAEWRWQEVERVVAIGDVHGAFPALVRTLENARVIDGRKQWAGGKTHLVVTGDLLDRGPGSRQVMDLLMRLEGEAQEAGGMVHVLLGNHEVMNLTGDLRYVSAAEYSAFSADENAADRERAFAVFRTAHADVTDEDTLQRRFAERTPPGWFGRRAAFTPDGRYGRWLLEKPFMVVIDDTAFVHGGLSPMVTDLGLDGVNRELKEQVALYARQFERVAGAGLVDVTENFFERPPLLEALPAAPERGPELARAIADVIRLSQAAVHRPDSPVWYRGNVGCSELIEQDKLQAALSAIGAARVVIGHTPTASHQVQQRFGGKVIEIDTGMLGSHYGGSGHALISEGGRLAVVGETGAEASSPVPQPRPTGLERSRLTVPELERILASGEIRSVTRDASGRTVVVLHGGDEDVPAVFTRKPRGRGFVPELAAYRIDRLLALDMVPVTVAREVDGREGTLQVRVANATDEASRRESGAGYGAYCPLPEQWQAMYVFDALIYNERREPQSMLYTPGEWRLMLTRHDHAFAAEDGRPEWLGKVDLRVDDAWKKALAALTDELLADRLGDVLDEDRLQALGERRDALLEE
jgi:hypothetical protein